MNEITEELRNAVHLGDGVYSKTDNEGTVTIFTSDGEEIMNTIYLDPEVIESLQREFKKAGYDRF